MNKLFVSVGLLLALNISHARQMDTNIELIQNAFNAYLEDFIDRDAAQIATHFQFPSLNPIGNPASIFHSLEEITKFWETFPLHNVYAYSTVADMALHRLSSSLYSFVFASPRYDSLSSLLFLLPLSFLFLSFFSFFLPLSFLSLLFFSFLLILPSPPRFTP